MDSWAATCSASFLLLPEPLGGGHCQSGAVDRVVAPVAQLAARRSHNPKVASSILAGSSYFFPFWGTKSRFVFLCLPRWRFYRLDGRAVQGASLRH